MKIHIIFQFKKSPTGGGNQFLLALREKLEDLGNYTDIESQADVILFNSFNFESTLFSYNRLLDIRRGSRKVVILHRIDGPISVVRGSARDLPVDYSIAALNNLLADGTIFQSNWSRKVCHSFGVDNRKFETVIYNAPNPRLFNQDGLSQKITVDKRIKIIASSWSANWRKGFDIYQFLDNELDHSRYEFIFVGNSPVSFNNIKLVPPLESSKLGKALCGADIYLTASVDDPCSNALIEALHCGLPVVARNSGGHPELVGESGELFNGHNDVLAAIEKVATSLKLIPTSGLPSMDKVATDYLNFAHKIYENIDQNQEPYSLTSVPKLNMGIAQARFWSSLTRRVTRVLPFREALFHNVPNVFREINLDSSIVNSWSETKAKNWVLKVINRLPLFLESMHSPNHPQLYRYSQTGDLQVEPSLASSVFATKIITMLGLEESTNLKPLAEHILSFQREDGSITDPWVASHSRYGRIYEALRSRSINNLFNQQTKRAETRQSMAALNSLKSKPLKPFTDLPKDSKLISNYISRLNWDKPWAAASHVSHLTFFMVQNAKWFNIGTTTDADDLLNQIESIYKRSDGAWYKEGSIISDNQKINGAMKMVTALDIAEIQEIQNPEGLIDICLSAINDGNACNHFNVICVLHRCISTTNYRQNEIRTYMVNRLRLYQDHYWPWQGGFSFYPTSANHRYYNARITTGMAEPDLHGTVLMLWGIVLICDVLGWSKELGVKRPYT